MIKRRIIKTKKIENIEENKNNFSIVKSLFKDQGKMNIKNKNKLDFDNLVIKKISEDFEICNDIKDNFISLFENEIHFKIKELETELNSINLDLLDLQK